MATDAALLIIVVAVCVLGGESFVRRLDYPALSSPLKGDDNSQPLRANVNFEHRILTKRSPTERCNSYMHPLLCQSEDDINFPTDINRNCDPNDANCDLKIFNRIKRESEPEYNKTCNKSISDEPCFVQFINRELNKIKESLDKKINDLSSKISMSSRTLISDDDSPSNKKPKEESNIKDCDPINENCDKTRSLDQFVENLINKNQSSKAVSPPQKSYKSGNINMRDPTETMSPKHQPESGNINIRDPTETMSPKHQPESGNINMRDPTETMSPKHKPYESEYINMRDSIETMSPTHLPYGLGYIYVDYPTESMYDPINSPYNSEYMDYPTEIMDYQINLDYLRLPPPCTPNDFMCTQFYNCMKIMIILIYHNSPYSLPDIENGIPTDVTCPCASNDYECLQRYNYMQTMLPMRQFVYPQSRNVNPGYPVPCSEDDQECQEAMLGISPRMGSQF